MSATTTDDSTKDSTRRATIDSPRMYPAFELGWSKWKPGFAAGLNSKPWRRTIPTRDLIAPQEVIAKARRRLDLPDDVPIFRGSNSVGYRSGVNTNRSAHTRRVPQQSKQQEPTPFPRP